MELPLHMENLKKLGFVLLAGCISFVIFGLLMVGLSFLIEIFREQNMLEARLFTDGFLKLIALVLFGSWLWLAGKFLNLDKPKAWGRKAFYIYFAASILPYVFSFFVTPSA
jgi:hypothetical protein